MANKIQLRRDTTVNWTTADPTLSQGEIGLDLTTGNIKIGTGLDSWSELDYAIPSILGLASEVYVDAAITALKAGAGSALDTLNELATALGNDANFSTTVTTQLALKANRSELSLVGTSGNYSDLLNKPVLFDGAYNSLTGKPTLFNGDYNNLSNKPTLFDGDYDSLTHKPTLFSGDYDDLTSKPVLFGGQYDDLSGKPTLFSGDYDDLTDKPTLFTGDYDDLTNKPTLFNGQYSSLTGKPTLSGVASTGEYNDLLNKPSLFSGSYTDLTNKPNLATVATSGDYADLSGIPRIPVYANDTARNSGIPTPVTGMMVLSNNVLQVYNGSSWVNV
jgi:hypothetical protein